ncbi:hypothetical protein [Halobacterium sp. KA-6]|uniref:hypothetical protein n=1 Tax=Halobacterium sp. KA-6 TaxID=2896368 RepID=UPI001E295539|nr:hypothetical protein [Halobacterium sp. KA-6]MCD2204400.1 hypothetical protein [Halobacterium sp. KA-6]
MASRLKDTTLDLPVAPITALIGVFALVGFGIGATGAVALTQLGDGSSLFSGIIFFIILTVAFLLGPLVAVFGGLQIGARLDRSPTAYLSSAIGTIGGYAVMMLVVIIVLSLALSIATSGGGGAAGSAAGSTGGAASTSSGTAAQSSINWMQYLIPIIGVAIPTGLVGVGGAYLGGRQDTTSDDGGRTMAVPLRPALAVVGVAILIAGSVAGAAAVTPGSAINLSSGDPADITVPATQVGYNGGDTLSVYATVNHTGSKLVETTVTAQFMVDGQSYDKWTSKQRVTLQPGESRQLTWTIADLVEGEGVADATDEQQTQINQGNFRIRILVNGEVAYSAPG